MAGREARSGAVGERAPGSGHHHGFSGSFWQIPFLRGASVTMVRGPIGKRYGSSVMRGGPGMARSVGADRNADHSTIPRGLVVLLVDDEPEWVKWLSCYLRDAGWVIVTASSGVDGLAACDESLPDVVIVDQKMPEMSGTEMAADLRDRGFTGPMLLLSASIDPDVNAECSRLAMHALSKLAHGSIFHMLDLFKHDVLARRPVNMGADAKGGGPSAGPGRSWQSLPV
jgi:CheY-like chemotaxis protein